MAEVTFVVSCLGVAIAIAAIIWVLLLFSRKGE